MSDNLPPSDKRQNVRFRKEVTTVDDLLPKGSSLEESLATGHKSYSSLDIDAPEEEPSSPITPKGSDGSLNKNPLARARTFVQQTLGAKDGEKEKARRSTSSLAKYGLRSQFKFDDDILSQTGDEDDGISVKTRESAAREHEDAGVGQRVGTIDMDLEDSDSDDEDSDDKRRRLLRQTRKRMVRYVLPLVVAGVVVGLGMLFETVGNSAAFEAENGFSYFALSCLIAIACVTWVLSRAIVYVIVKVYIRRFFALNFKLNYSLRGAHKPFPAGSFSRPRLQLLLTDCFLESLSMTFAVWSVIMLALVYLVPWTKLNYDGHETPPTAPTSYNNLLKLFFFFFLSGAVFVARLYSLKTMMFDFHQNTYVERLRVYYFLEYVLNRLSVSPVLSELSKVIWANLCRADGDGMVMADDFERFVSPKHARQAFEIFDIDGSDFVTREEVDRVCRKYIKERRNLRLSVDDHRTIVNRLSKFFTGIALVTCMVFFFIIFSDIAQTLIVPAMTTILGFTFIFGSYASNTFENAAFLFQQHPYDVGDRVFIDEENLIVQSIEFSRTTFDRWDGRRISYPNSLLRSKIIVNVRRSPPMSSMFKFEVGSGVPNAKIQEFESRLKAFLKANPKDFFPDATVDVSELCTNMRCVMQFSVKHRDNWQDGGLRWRRHNMAGNFARQCLDDMGIRFYNPLQNVEVKQVSEFSNPFANEPHSTQFN